MYVCVYVYLIHIYIYIYVCICCIYIYIYVYIMFVCMHSYKNPGAALVPASMATIAPTSNATTPSSPTERRCRARAIGRLGHCCPLRMARRALHARSVHRSRRRDARAAAVRVAGGGGGAKRQGERGAKTGGECQIGFQTHACVQRTHTLTVSITRSRPTLIALRYVPRAATEARGGERGAPTRVCVFIYMCVYIYILG